MPRYIDADKLIDKIFPIGLIDDGNYTINAKAVKIAIDKMPTADVVECIHITEDMIKGHCDPVGERGEDGLLHIKQEVAREIFEEIEKEISFFKKYMYANESVKAIVGVLEELKKKYTESEDKEC